jgi:hypothetical protein
LTTRTIVLYVAAALAIPAAAVLFGFDMGEQAFIDTEEALAPPVYAARSVAPETAVTVSPDLTPTPGTAVAGMAVSGAATSTLTATRRPPTTPPRPAPIPGDCARWAAIFTWYGATPLEVQYFFGDARPWGVPRSNIIGNETGCGSDFINESTSDRYICQLNGINWEPGYAYSTYYPNGWPMDLFGFRGGRDVTTQAEASNPDLVTACLWLLRGGFTPDTFNGARHWMPV